MSTSNLNLSTVIADARFTRRHLLAWFSIGSVAAVGGLAVLPAWARSSPGPGAVGPLDGVAGPVDRAGAGLEATYRFVNRLTWGATDADVARCQSLGQRAWLREQFMATGEPLPDPVQARIDTMSIEQRSVLARRADSVALRRARARATDDDARETAKKAYREMEQLQLRETAQRHLLRAVHSPAQLREQMTWFWFNHFNVFQRKHEARSLIADYEDHAIRPHALGSFRAMLGAVTTHAVMLQYLDNFKNVAGQINENHARELLELHTLGVDGGYTQQDVQELARVMTGHDVGFGDPAKRRASGPDGVVRGSGFHAFDPARHDFGDKLILGHRIRGRGAAELDEVLDMLATHPATARFVSRKMAQFLMADEPPAALVDSMASAFAGGRIAPAIEVLAFAPAFTAGVGKFKDPMHFVVSAVRSSSAGRLVSNEAAMAGWLNRLGEGLYNRLSPDGYPLTADAWNSSGQLATRFDIARAIGADTPPLFNAEVVDPGTQPRRDPPAASKLAGDLFRRAVEPGLGPNTRTALAAATSAADWNALWLASPEFMLR